MTVADTYQSLVASLNEWQYLLVNPRFARRGSIISWHGYSPHRIDDPLSHDRFVEIADAGQYSFQLVTDGALLQLEYRFGEDSSLKFASLGYISGGERDYPALGWLRIDYDPENERGSPHSACHMHIGLLPSSRLLVSGVPTPKQFIEFVVALCYPDIYSTHRTDRITGSWNYRAQLAVNSPSFEIPQPPETKSLTHLRVPAEAPTPVEDRPT